jgi:hypothetical protein
MKTAATVKSSEAGGSTRGETAGLSAALDPAESTRADAALAAGRSISPGCPVVSFEGPGGSTGMIESSAPVDSAAIEVAAVIKCGAPREISTVVKQHVMVTPIESPMTPSPSEPTEPTDTEPNSK